MSPQHYVVVGSGSSQIPGAHHLGFVVEIASSRFYERPCINNKKSSRRKYLIVTSFRLLGSMGVHGQVGGSSVPLPVMVVSPPVAEEKGTHLESTRLPITERKALSFSIVQQLIGIYLHSGS